MVVRKGKVILMHNKLFSRIMTGIMSLAMMAGIILPSSVAFAADAVKCTSDPNGVICNAIMSDPDYQAGAASKTQQLNDAQAQYTDMAVKYQKGLLTIERNKYVKLFGTDEQKTQFAADEKEISAVIDDVMTQMMSGQETKLDLTDAQLAAIYDENRICTQIENDQYTKEGNTALTPIQLDMALVSDPIHDVTIINNIAGDAASQQILLYFQQQIIKENCPENGDVIAGLYADITQAYANNDDTTAGAKLQEAMAYPEFAALMEKTQDQANFDAVNAFNNSRDGRNTVYVKQAADAAAADEEALTAESQAEAASLEQTIDTLTKELDKYKYLSMSPDKLEAWIASEYGTYESTRPSDPSADCHGTVAAYDVATQTVTFDWSYDKDTDTMHYYVNGKNYTETNYTPAASAIPHCDDTTPDCHGDISSFNEDGTITYKWQYVSSTGTLYLNNCTDVPVEAGKKNMFCLTQNADNFLIDDYSLNTGYTPASVSTDRETDSFRYICPKNIVLSGNNTLDGVCITDPDDSSVLSVSGNGSLNCGLIHSSNGMNISNVTCTASTIESCKDIDISDAEIHANVLATGNGNQQNISAMLTIKNSGIDLGNDKLSYLLLNGDVFTIGVDSQTNGNIHSYALNGQDMLTIANSNLTINGAYEIGALGHTVNITDTLVKIDCHASEHVASWSDSGSRGHISGNIMLRTDMSVPLGQYSNQSTYEDFYYNDLYHSTGIMSRSGMLLKNNNINISDTLIGIAAGKSFSSQQNILDISTGYIGIEGLSTGSAEDPAPVNFNDDTVDIKSSIGILVPRNNIAAQNENAALSDPAKWLQDQMTADIALYFQTLTDADKADIMNICNTLASKDSAEQNNAVNELKTKYGDTLAAFAAIHAAQLNDLVKNGAQQPITFTDCDMTITATQYNIGIAAYDGNSAKATAYQFEYKEGNAKSLLLFDKEKELQTTEGCKEYLIYRFHHAGAVLNTIFVNLTDTEQCERFGTVVSKDAEGNVITTGIIMYDTLNNVYSLPVYDAEGNKIGYSHLNGYNNTMHDAISGLCNGQIVLVDTPEDNIVTTRSSNAPAAFVIRRLRNVAYKTMFDSLSVKDLGAYNGYALETADLPVLTQKGYKFLGWYYDPEYKTEVKEGDTLTQDTTVYAKWVQVVEPETPKTAIDTPAAEVIQQPVTDDKNEVPVTGRSNYIVLYSVIMSLAVLTVIGIFTVRRSKV